MPASTSAAESVFKWKSLRALLKDFQRGSCSYFEGEGIPNRGAVPLTSPGGGTVRKDVIFRSHPANRAQKADTSSIPGQGRKRSVLQEPELLCDAAPPLRLQSLSATGRLCSPSCKWL